MAAEKKWTDVFVDVCGLLMKEVGMPSTALAELRRRANAITTTELESFQSVMFWKSASVNFFDLQEKLMLMPEYSKDLAPPVSDTFVTPVSDKAQIPDLNEPPIPDLNQPAILDLNQPPPQNEMQDIGMAVEAEASTTAGKRKITEGNHSVIKRYKFTQESVGPVVGDKGKGVPKMESWGEN